MSHSCDEQYQIYDERTFKANKAHECDACDLPIRKGDRYTRVFTLFDGRKEHYKRCLRCQLLHEHLRVLAPGEMWPDERLNCGTLYADEWGPAPAWVNALAFWSPGERLPDVNPCTVFGYVERQRLTCKSVFGWHGAASCRGYWARTKASGTGTEVCS